MLSKVCHFPMGVRSTLRLTIFSILSNFRVLVILLLIRNKLRGVLIFFEPLSKLFLWVVFALLEVCVVIVLVTSPSLVMEPIGIIAMLVILVLIISISSFVSIIIESLVRVVFSPVLPFTVPAYEIIIGVVSVVGLVIVHLVAMFFLFMVLIVLWKVSITLIIFKIILVILPTPVFLVGILFVTLLLILLVLVIIVVLESLRSMILVVWRIIFKAVREIIYFGALWLSESKIFLFLHYFLIAWMIPFLVRVSLWGFRRILLKPSSSLTAAICAFFHLILSYYIRYNE